VPDPTALAAFDWLMDEVESLGGLKLMMTLTNCLADYGGMQQYVRWVMAGSYAAHACEFVAALSPT
jgi:endo-1,4-beta-mannosidase